MMTGESGIFTPEDVAQVQEVGSFVCVCAHLAE